MEMYHFVVDCGSQRSCNKCNHHHCTLICNKKTKYVADLSLPGEINASYSWCRSVDKWYQVQRILRLWCCKFISSTITHLLKKPPVRKEKEIIMSRTGRNIWFSFKQT